MRNCIQMSSLDTTTSSSSATEDSAKEEQKFVFKSGNFSYYKNVSNKKKIWKSLKQIISQERNLNWPKNTILYNSIVAPPSFKPPKKYSDISGVKAKYVDPQTKLYFSTIEEFTTIRGLPSDIINGYLLLRGEHNPIG